MKIEEGRYYRTRGGEFVGPMRLRDGATHYPFGSTNYGETASWTEDGRWNVETKNDHRDLIADVTGLDTTVPYEAEERLGKPIDLAAAISQADEINCTVPRIVIPGYEALADTLQSALDQSQAGKGKERHANDKPFDRQPIMEIGRMVGLGYPTGQASKKIQEAVGMFNRDEADRAVNELLGAIVYSAAAILLIREQKGI